MRYTFGNTITAAERLKLIAGFFDPLASEMIKNHVHGFYNTALDLGCGPGYTTNMVHNSVDCINVYGLDNSENFIQIARSNFSNITFCKHDVTKIPFPVKGDFMYARFLLSHLNNINDLIKNWIDQLNPGGILFIDELYDIYTEKAVFKNYLNISKNLIKSQGADLYIGKKLDGATKELNIVYEEVTEIPVYNYQAATWFYPNTVSIWETDEYVFNTTLKEERNEISQILNEMRLYTNKKNEITWYMKRIFLKQTDKNSII